MKNKITNLRNHLFLSLERLNDEDLTAEELQQELKRSKAIANIGKVLVGTAKVEVAYIKAVKGADTKSKFLDTPVQAGEAPKPGEGESKKLPLFGTPE